MIYVLLKSSKEREKYSLLSTVLNSSLSESKKKKLRKEGGRKEKKEVQRKKRKNSELEEREKEGRLSKLRTGTENLFFC